MKKKLKSIYENFKSNQPYGIDGISKTRYDEILDKELDIINRKILNNTYEFSYYKQKYIIKPNGTTRLISIPTIRDKIVIRYLYDYIFDIFKEDIQKKDAFLMIQSVIKNRKYFNSFIKVDIKNFFPTIDHKILFDTLSKYIDKDSIIFSLIQKAVKQTTVNISTSKQERVKYSNTIGVPQGLSISSILSDIYLIDFDKKYKNNHNIKYYRFVDDILILCDKKDLQDLKESIEKDINYLKLKIHEFNKNNRKSFFGSLNDKFSFLGYVFYGDTISIRQSSYQKIFNRINNVFFNYKQKKIADLFYDILNIKISGVIIDGKKYGWIKYYSLINDYKLLYMLDNFVEKKCQKNAIDYTKIKRFSKAIFEIKKPDSNYILKLKKRSDGKFSRIQKNTDKHIVNNVDKEKTNQKQKEDADELNIIINDMIKEYIENLYMVY